MPKYSGLENVGIWGMMSAGKISFISNKTGEEKLYLDYANTFTVSYDYSDVNARGRGTDMVSWRSPITATGELGLEISSLEQMALSSGATIGDNKIKIYNRMSVTASKPNDTITLKEAPVEGSVKAYVVLNDGITKKAGKTITMTKGADAKSFTMTGSAQGDNIIINYQVEKSAKSFTLSAIEKESESYTMVIHADAKTHIEGSLVPIQIVFGNVKLNPSTETALDAENPVNFSISVKLMSDKNGDICTWSYVPDVEEATAQAQETPAPKSQDAGAEAGKQQA